MDDKLLKSYYSVVKEANSTVLGIVLLVVKYALLSLFLAAVWYSVFALVVSTDKEKQLRKENRMYERIYPQMLEDEALISDVINNLQLKDRQIYKDVFYANAPNMDPINSTDFLAVSDSIPDRNIVKFTKLKADALMRKSAGIEARFLEIDSLCRLGNTELPPLVLPLEGVSYVQLGASVGDKLNPFYKVPTRHEGLDIIAPQGDAVFASASGTVASVKKSFKGEGNVVEIYHSDSFSTRYCHLGDITVRQGAKVEVGQKIAEVGISGSSFMPHLHYEIIRNGVKVDPVHYFFASVSPDQYANMLYMSVNTGQSMD